MKSLSFSFFAFLFTLAAGEYADAEKLFQQGKFSECAAVIEDLLQNDVSAPQKNKLLAMREYIWGNDPDKIAGLIDKAKEIAGQRGLSPSELLNHSFLLVRRAEDWKARRIPEYQDLVNAARTLLERLKDGGDPEIAIKQVILLTKLDNLDGEYMKPIRQIREILQMYYPRDQKGTSQKSSGEAALLILLGEQYAGLGASAQKEQEKTEALASCARCYLEAIAQLPKSSSQYQDLVDRLFLCREILRLLGYDLRLPPQIKPQKSAELAIIDEMFRNRRFQDAVKALETKNDPAMRLRYAVALSAIGQPDKAVPVVKELKEISDPYLILQAAQFSFSAGKRDEALFFFNEFLQREPNSPDSLSAWRQYTFLLIENGRYAEGAAGFLQQEEIVFTPEEKEDAIFHAAQCFYKAGMYGDCIQLFSRINNQTPERSILLAHAYIISNAPDEALSVLKRMLSENDLSDEKRCDAMKLAISCAEDKFPKDAVVFLEQFLKLYPQDPDAIDYSKKLLFLYGKTRATPEKFVELANFFLSRTQQKSDVIPFLLSCSNHIPDMVVKENLLRKLFGQKEFSVDELKFLLMKLPTPTLKHEFLLRYKKDFENTPEICDQYFQLAEVEYALHDYHSSLINIEKLLSQQEVFRYKDCKRLQIQCNLNLGNEPAARKACQEYLLTKLTPQEKSDIILTLSLSWERSGELKKAIASAWSGIPLTNEKTDGIDKKVLRELLNLIVRNAEKIKSPSDIQDAKILLEQL